MQKETGGKIMAEKKKFQMPHAYIIMLMVIALCTILTHIIPAGVYDFVEVNGKNVVDPNSFHYVDPTPVGFWDMLLSIPQGMVKNASLIFCTFLVTGAIKIIDSTGALAATIGRFITRIKEKLYLAIPLFMIPFALLGGLGISNQIVAFVPLGCTVALALGADPIVGVAMILMGMSAGFCLAPFGMSTTGNAQTIAGIPLFSGAGFRWICIIVLWIFAGIYLFRYAKKVQADPKKSIVYGTVNDVVAVSEQNKLPEVTKRRVAVLIVYVAAVAYIFYNAFMGTIDVGSLAATFILAGVISGIVYGYKPNQIANLFVEGAKSITFGALIIGLGASISIVLTNGNIIYTVVHALCSLLTGMPKILAAIVLNLINGLVNFVIMSGSGHAAAVMPILGPTAQVIGLTQQTTILCYELGATMTDMILPTSSTLMGALAVAGVPYEKWVKFFWKFLVIEMLLGFVFVSVAVLINWGAVYG